MTIEHTMDVAQRPSGSVRLPDGTYRAWGERDGVLLAVLLSPVGDVLTSYPVAGDGVVQNEIDEQAAPRVELLGALLDRMVTPSTEEPRCSMDELLAVGEWPHLILSLEALGAEHPALASLRELAGL